MSRDEMEAVLTMRKVLSGQNTQEAGEEIIDNLAHTKTNRDFIEIIKRIFGK